MSKFKKEEVKPTSFAEMEIKATVAFDGDTRRCCNDPDCGNDYPCEAHPTATQPTEEFDPLKRFPKCPRCGHYPWKMGTFPAYPESCGFHTCGCKHECHNAVVGGGATQPTERCPQCGSPDKGYLNWACFAKFASKAHEWHNPYSSTENADALRFKELKSHPLLTSEVGGATQSAGTQRAREWLENIPDHPLYKSGRIGYPPLGMDELALMLEAYAESRVSQLSAEPRLPTE